MQGSPARCIAYESRRSALLRKGSTRTAPTSASGPMGNAGCGFNAHEAGPRLFNRTDLRCVSPPGKPDRSDGPLSDGARTVTDWALASCFWHRLLRLRSFSRPPMYASNFTFLASRPHLACDEHDGTRVGAITDSGGWALQAPRPHLSTAYGPNTRASTPYQHNA